MGANLNPERRTAKPAKRPRREILLAWRWLWANGPEIRTTDLELAAAWGCHAGTVARRLRRLAELGALAFTRPGPGELAIGVCRRPVARTVGQSDGQLGLDFGDGEEFRPRVVSEDAEGSGQSAFTLESASACASDPQSESACALPDENTPYTRARAPASMETIEGVVSTTPSYHDKMVNHGSEGSGFRVQGSGQEDEPAPIGEAVAGALARLCEATAEGKTRERILGEISAAVADPDMHPSIAGRAADLVVAGKLAYEDLTRILQDIRLTRRKGGFAEPDKRPGKLFLWRLRRLPGWIEPRSRSPPGA